MKPVRCAGDLVVLLGNGARLGLRETGPIIGNNTNISRREGKNKISLITLLFGVNDGGGLPLTLANISHHYSTVGKYG